MADMNAQVYRVLGYMKEHGSITQREALELGIYCLAPIISDIKQKKLAMIKTELVTVNNIDGSTSRVERYSIDG